VIGNVSEPMADIESRLATLICTSKSNWELRGVLGDGGEL
jgi:hypothetical protein